MVRRVPTDRIERLIECATEVFIDQGYRRTQMSDIASALGVAKGTLYLYVDSKEAPFDLVARYADDLRALPKPVKLPVSTPRPGATVRYVRERLSRNQVPQTLVAALGARRVSDACAELRDIAGELFDTLAANRRGIKLLDRSARDLPELAALWFQGARGGLIRALQSYLDDRVRGGLLRAFPDTAVAARIAIEILVFWAVHRHWDPQPQIVEEAAVRDTVTNLSSAHSLTGEVTMPKCIGNGPNQLKRLLVGLVVVLSLTAAFIIGTRPVLAASAEPVGQWYAEGGAAIVEIRPCGGALCGRVVWLHSPLDQDGCELRDKNNPDPALRNRRLVGLQILDGLVASDHMPVSWTGGTIYDPVSGNTYRCRLELDGHDRLRLRGYVGIPLVGRTTTWTRVGSYKTKCTQ